MIGFAPSAAGKRTTAGEVARREGKTGPRTREMSAGLAHGFDHGFRIGELTRGQLGIYLPAIDGDFKRAAAGRHQLERTDALFELEELVRQTDGKRLVVSSRAIFDGDFQTHNDSVRAETRLIPRWRQAGCFYWDIRGRNSVSGKLRLKGSILRPLFSRAGAVPGFGEKHIWVHLRFNRVLFEPVLEH